MLARRRTLDALMLSGALVVSAAAAPVPASAQSKLEAQYSVTLAGLPIARGNWVITVGDTQYSAAASGVTTGLMRIITGGEGSTAVNGNITAGKLSSTYAATIKTRKKSEEVRIAVQNGNVKDFRINPPVDPDHERVPLSAAHERGVLDPMTGSMLRVPGKGDPLTPEACKRKLPIFDGRMRYDIQLAYKRMDEVRADKGYAGPVVVCAVYFVPVAGHNPTRRTVKYLMETRDTEVWLAPIAGTRVLVPFRIQGPTPIGVARLEAERFVAVPGPTRASLDSGNPR